jgi:hypothetical protein
MVVVFAGLVVFVCDRVLLFDPVYVVLAVELVVLVLFLLLVVLLG